jgi:hypothetical protein
MNREVVVAASGDEGGSACLPNPRINDASVPYCTSIASAPRHPVTAATLRYFPCRIADRTPAPLVAAVPSAADGA